MCRLDWAMYNQFGYDATPAVEQKVRIPRFCLHIYSSVAAEGTALVKPKTGHPCTKAAGFRRASGELGRIIRRKTRLPYTILSVLSLEVP